jgi:hypothetical protein
MKTGLCILDNHAAVDPVRLETLLQKSPLRWRVVCAGDAARLAGALAMEDLPRWLDPVGYYDQSFLRLSRALYRFLGEVDAGACWLVGNPALAFVGLQARAAGLGPDACRWILTPSGDGGPSSEWSAATPDFPEALIEGYARRRALEWADIVERDPATAITALDALEQRAFVSVTSEAGIETPLISVCIAHYNYGSYLVEQLASLRAQTYANFEVIVVDDGSTDAETLEIWEGLRERFPEPTFRFHRRKLNKGLSATRNEAVEHARGEWLVFCDADNRSHPLMLQRLAEAARRTGADLVTCYARQFSRDESGAERMLEYSAPLGDCLELGWLFNVFGDANALIRRDTYLSSGGFKSRPGESSEDWRFFAELVWRGASLRVVPEVLFDYRVHPQSVMRTSTESNPLQELLAVYSSQLEALPEGRLREYWRRMLAALPGFHAWRGQAQRLWSENQRVWETKQAQDAVVAALREDLKQARQSVDQSLEQNHALGEQLEQAHQQVEAMWRDRQAMEAFLTGQVGERDRRIGELADQQQQAHQQAEAMWRDRQAMEAFLTGQIRAREAEVERLAALAEQRSEQLTRLDAWARLPLWKRLGNPPFPNATDDRPE